VEPPESTFPGSRLERGAGEKVRQGDNSKFRCLSHQGNGEGIQEGSIFVS